MNTWWESVVSKFQMCFITDDRYMLLVKGFGVTIETSLLAVIIGVIIGMIIALFALSNSKALRMIAKVYTDIIRGTPSVTQLMIIYFVIFATVPLPKWIIASIAFGINSGAYVSEIIRGGILSVDKGQTEAGRSLGLSASQTMTDIVIPQAVKNIFPSLCNEFISLIKETAIVGYVALDDLTRAAFSILVPSSSPRSSFIYCKVTLMSWPSAALVEGVTIGSSSFSACLYSLSNL